MTTPPRTRYGVLANDRNYVPDIGRDKLPSGYEKSPDYNPPPTWRDMLATLALMVIVSLIAAYLLG